MAKGWEAFPLQWELDPEHLGTFRFEHFGGVFLRCRLGPDLGHFGSNFGSKTGPSRTTNLGLFAPKGPPGDAAWANGALGEPQGSNFWLKIEPNRRAQRVPKMTQNGSKMNPIGTQIGQNRAEKGRHLQVGGPSSKIYIYIYTCTSKDRKARICSLRKFW